MSNRNGDDVVKATAAVVWNMPVMLLRITVSYLRFKRDVHRSTKSFRKGLKESDLPPDVVKSLCKSYDEETSVFRHLVTSGINGFGFVPK